VPPADLPREDWAYHEAREGLLGAYNARPWVDREAAAELERALEEIAAGGPADALAARAREALDRYRGG
jgi:hypothetical protein